MAPNGGLADAMKPGGRKGSLAEAADAILDLDASLPRTPLRQVSYGALPSYGPAPATGGRSYLEEFGDSFLHTLSEQNPTMFGHALETMGILMESDTMFDWGLDLQDFAKRNSMGMPGSVPSWSNVVDAEGVGDFLDKTARYVAAGLGTALGSMTPQIATGLGGAGLGLATLGPAGVLPGTVAGSLVPSVAMNMGEAYGTFVEEGVDRYRAAEWAAAITPFTAGLDALGFTKLITRGADTSGPLLRYIGRRIARGYLAEATTEGAQAAIKEATAAHLTDNPDLAGRATKILDEFLIGGMGGAAISGAGAVIGGRGRRAGEPPLSTETPEMTTETGDSSTDLGDLPPEETGAVAEPPPPETPAAEPPPAETVTIALPDTILKKNRQPFPTRRAAQAAKRNRNLDEHEIIEVEGGFALQRPGTEPPTAAAALDEVNEAPVDAETALREDAEWARESSELVQELEAAGAIERVEAAAAETDTEPTDAQKEAGNYRKGTVKLQGLDIAIENPQGSERSGRAPDGTEWKVTMPAHYGYVRRTEGADGDQVDVYIGPEPTSENVFIVDQVDADSKAFDEHKVMLGYPDEAAALADYDAAFDDGRGPDRRKAVGALTMDQFKAWLAGGNTAQPFSAPLEEFNAEAEPTEEQRAEEQEEPPAAETTEQPPAEAPEAAPAEEPAAEAVEEPPDVEPEPEPARAPAAEAPEAAPEVAETPEPEDAGSVQEDGGGAAVDAPLETDDQPDRIRKRDGSPYPTLKSANAAKRGRGLEDYDPVRVEGGYELVRRGAEPEVEEEVEAEPEPRQIGTNSDDAPLFEDERGVRSYVSDGVRQTEAQRMGPQGERIPSRPEQRSGQFLTEEERAATTEPEVLPESGPVEPAGGEVAEPAPAPPQPRPPRRPRRPRTPQVAPPETAPPETAPAPRRRRSGRAQNLSDQDKAARDALAQAFMEDMDDGDVRMAVRPGAAGRVRPISPRVQQAGIEFGRRLMAGGDTTYQDWSNALLDAMDDVQDGLGDRFAPYTRMIYEALRYDPANDFAADMTPISEIDEGGTDGDTERLPDDAADAPGDERPGDAADAPAGGAGGAGGVPGDPTGRGAEPAGDQASAEQREPEPEGDQDGDREGGAAGLPAGETEPRGPERDDGPGAGSVGLNIRLTEDDYLLEGRPLRQKAEDNLAALELLSRVEASGRPATAEEQAILARYTGWGGLKGMFPNIGGSYGRGFEDLGKQLKGMLSDADYATAERSVQFAHYTSAEVIQFMWAAVQKMGFPGGTIIEPGMGIGHFAGFMPDAVAANPYTSYFGIERDHVTARIAKQLYPTYSVVQGDYTRRKVPRDQFALAIGNPPFSANTILADPEYASHKFLLHDYFFAKTLDAIQPGGILAFVTSAGTMNKIDQGARRYMADRADLIAAVRLPGGDKGAFSQSSNTQVTTDVIFLRKRRPGEQPGNQDWVETETVNFIAANDEPIPLSINKYFRKNPDRVLGKEGPHDKLIPNRYGVIPRPGDDLPTMLADILASLPTRQWNAQQELEFRERVAEIETAENRKEGSFFVADGGDLMQVNRGQGVEVVRRGQARAADTRLGFTLTANEMDRVKDLVAVRDSLIEVMKANVARDEGSAVPAREALSQAYDAFFDKHGPLNLKKVRKQKYSRREQESMRDQEREAARQGGEWWFEGSFDPPPSFYELSMSARAAERQRAREAAEAAGEPFSEGSFDPDSLGMKEIASYPNLKGFETDPKYFVVAAIEDVNHDTDEISKGAIFERNVLASIVEPEIRTVEDAVAVIMARHGRFDLDLLVEVYGKDRDTTIRELGDFIFELPGQPGSFMDGSEYLSGDVKTKLYAAAKAADKDPRFERNVQALEAVIPKDVLPSDIGMSAAASWMPIEIKTAFAEHLGLERVTITFNEVSRTTRVEGTPTAASETQWGSRRARPQHLLSNILNSKPSPRHYDRHSDGSSTLNVEDTQESREKYQAIADEWAAFMDGRPELQDDAATAYNEIVNRFIPRQYDGSWVKTPGISADWELRDFQKRVIARIIQSGNTYMAHAVGAGKTAAMVSAGMELRRLGLSRKPMFVVPNPMLRQFSLEFLHQYPNANVAVADETRFSAARRQQFVSAVALDDSLDAVIITHSAFKRMSMSPEFMQGIADEEILKLSEVLSELEDEDAPKWHRNQVQAQIDKIEDKIASLQAAGDEVVSFEETGVDFLFIDEAHVYRKLGLATSQAIKGIDPAPSGQAMDLYYKLRYLDDMNKGRAAVFASGTPVVNTLGEAYNISRYLQEDQLKALGIHTFDEWAANFATTKTDYEMDAAGGYNPVERFAEIVNLAELQHLLGQMADHVSSDQLAENVVRPTIQSPGQNQPGRERVVVPASEAQMDYKDDLEDRMEEIKNRDGPPGPGEDNHLVVINDGRKSAIDMRLVDSESPNDPTSKLNRMIDNIWETYQRTQNQPFYRVNAAGSAFEDTPAFTGPGTQIAFMSLGLGDVDGFSAKDWVVTELMRRGIPQEEIAFINDFKTNNAKRRLFNDMNDGRVRVLLGHPMTLGTGVNVQRRLAAIHNLDPLWFPALDEQRVGRIHRQGNMNPYISVQDYATEGTYDVAMWQIMLTKATFIHDIWKQTGARRVEDMAIDFMAAMRDEASGDPRLLRRSQLEKRIRDLEQERRLVRSRQEATRSQARRLERDVERYTQFIEAGERDLAQVQDVSGDKFEITFVFSGRDDFVVKERKDSIQHLEAGLRVGKLAPRRIATFAGFDLEANPQGFRIGFAMPGAGDITAGLDRDDQFAVGMGTLQSMGNAIRSLPERVQKMRDRLADTQRQLEEVQAQAGPAFGQEKIDEIASSREEVHRIDNQISTERATRQEQRQEARRRAAEDDGGVSTTSARARQEAARGMTADAVHGVVAPIAQTWGFLAPQVEVVPTFARLPENVQRSLINLWDGPMTEIRGAMHDPKDGSRPTIYMIAANLDSAEDARRTLAHEVIGHYSMREMLGGSFKGLLSEVLRLARDGDRRTISYIDRIRDTYGQLSPDIMAEEVIAHMAEDGIKHPLTVRAIAVVRRFLRSLGFRISFSYAEVQDMIVRADRRLRTGRVERAMQEATHTTRLPDSLVTRGTKLRREKEFLDEVRAAIRPKRRQTGKSFQPIDRLFRIPFAAVGGLDSRGDWKWSKPMLNSIRHVVQDMKPEREGAFGFLGPMIDKARHGLIDRYGTPSDFIVRERQAHTDRFTIMAELSAHLQAFQDAEMTADDALALQEILEGQPADTERMARLAEPIRKSLDAMGAELVDLGLLSPDSYAENFGKWLHRSYREYETNAPALVRWKRNADKRRRQALHGDELMRRGRRHRVGGPGRLMRDVPANMRESVKNIRNWEIWDRKSPSGRVTKRIYWPASIERNDAIFGAGVWESQGTWARRTGKGGQIILARDWTKAEREHMGEIRDARYNLIKSFELLAHDLAQGRMFDDISRNTEWFSRSQPELGTVIDAGDARFLDTFSGIDWVKVPSGLIPKSNTKRWGKLAGGYIRAPIWRDLLELQKMQKPSIWGEALRWWKKFKTVHSPVVHFNNVMGNVILADMVDVTFSDLARAAQEFTSEGEYFKEAQAEGVFQSGYAMMELDKNQRNKLLNEIIGQVEEERHGSAMQRMMALFAAFDEKMTSAYRFEDEFFRLADYIKHRNMGETREQAAQCAIEHFLNYDIRAPWVNALRRSVLPFFSYTYRFVPAMVQNIARKPWKLAKYFTIGYALQALSYEMVEGDEEDERAAMADRDKGYTWAALPKMLRLPFEDKHGDPYYINLTRILPGGGLMDTDKGQLPLPEWMLISGPIAMASDLLSNRIAFTGQDIVNREIDTTWEAMGKRFAYTARSVLPNAPWIPGSWTVQTIQRALGDNVDFRGRQYSEMQAFVRAAGPKISTFDLEGERTLREFEFRRAERAFRERLYKLRMDRARNRMSESNFQRQVEKVFDGMLRLQKKRERMFGGDDG